MENNKLKLSIKTLQSIFSNTNEPTWFLNARKLALTRGVTTFIEERTLPMEEMLNLAPKFAKESGLAKEGDYILITAGQPDLGKDNVPPTDFVHIRQV